MSRGSAVSTRVVRSVLAVGAAVGSGWYATVSTSHALAVLSGAVLGALLGRWPDGGVRRGIAACGLGGLVFAFTWRISVGGAYGLAWSAMLALTQRSDRVSKAMAPPSGN